VFTRDSQKYHNNKRGLQQDTIFKTVKHYMLHITCICTDFTDHKIIELLIIIIIEL